MSEFINKMMAMSPAELRRIRTLRGKKRGTYKMVPRPSRSREELEEFIRSNNIKTRSQLLKFRSDEDPSTYDYMKEFGSWTASMDFIWNLSKEEIKFDRYYVVMAVIEFGLWTCRAYAKARKLRPDILPSTKLIKNEFGSWGVLKDMAMSYSLKETLASYLELKVKLKKRPTEEDCRKARLDIGKAIELFGSLRKFDQFVVTMEEII